MSKDQRAHPRIESAIEAKLLINGGQHGRATVRDLSAGGLAFNFDGTVDVGSKVVAHLAGGTRLEGAVARTFEGGFAIALAMSDDKRWRLEEKLAAAGQATEKLDALTLERRLATRVPGARQSVVCEIGGRRIEARVIDMSLTGVAIETDAALEPGEPVVIGKMRGVIARQDGKRYGVRFLKDAEDEESASPRDPIGEPARAETGATGGR